MTSTAWPVYSPFARKHYGQGRSEGIREAGIRIVLRLLAERGIDVPGEVRTRISACTDVDQLECWAVRAGSVQSAQDLFDDPDEACR
ncbi:MAG: hypothetical protein HOV96_40305 [Nonomuraea sp.]|nr:hypothetical protein [Nonomuraea sp.]